MTNSMVLNAVLCEPCHLQLSTGNHDHDKQLSTGNHDHDKVKLIALRVDVFSEGS
jgi:hypothetical protein